MEIKTLQIFTDYVCPWCYLGQARLKKVISKYKINLDIIHFPLHPDTPNGGRNKLVKRSGRDSRMTSRTPEKDVSYWEVTREFRVVSIF